jgi:hypothetical protein
VKRIVNLEGELTTLKEEPKKEQQCHAHATTSREGKYKRWKPIKSFLLQTIHHCNPNIQ